MGLDRFYYNGQIVITRKQLAEIMEVKAKTLGVNYFRNMYLFSEGVHFYNLGGTELKRFKLQNSDIFKKYCGKRCGWLFLYTFEGCLLALSTVNLSPSQVEQSVSRLKQYFNIDASVQILPHIVKEKVCLDKVKKLLDGIDICIPQYQVGNYRIDLYCPNLNLAIEFDERHHRNCVPNDLLRQKSISKQLGCQFVRINDREDFEVSANKILKAILNNKNITRGVM